MLPNEKFALECRAYYDEIGLVVDEKNGQFAHCPYPEGMGETGYYLLHDHHQQQGLLQSKDVGRCCFFNGHAKKWLTGCDPFPDNYFELWDIYNEYAGENSKKSRETAALSYQSAVELTDMVDGSVFIFDSVKDAARAKNLHRNHLYEVCRGEKYSAGGFLARCWTPDVKDWGKGLFHLVEGVKKKKEESYRRVGKATKLRFQKPVELTRILDGSVFVFEGVHEAARSLNLNRGNLSSVCLGDRKTVGGFTARYLDLKPEEKAQ